MIYPSRIDALAAIGIGSVALSVPACLGLGVWMLSSSVGGAIVFFGCGVSLAALLLLVAWPVHYTLDEHQLVIRFGMMRARIPYAEIQEVSPSRSLLAGPALSRDRLLIRHRGGEALISPRDQQGFLRELAARDAGLAVTGDGARITRR